MKIQNYPTLEKCKKLKETGGFLETEMIYESNDLSFDKQHKEVWQDFTITWRDGMHTNGPRKIYPCPSTKEMIDVLQRFNNESDTNGPIIYHIFINSGWKGGGISDMLLKMGDPNYVADMVLGLVKNNILKLN